MTSNPITQTTRPIVTGTSVVAVRTDSYVVMAADTLGAYGSLAKFCNVQRIRKVGDDAMVGAGGEISDFQQIMEYLEDLETQNFCYADGVKLHAPEIHSYLSRVCYNKRSRLNPFYNQFLVAGYTKNGPYLGYTDLYGTTFVDNYAATGYGLHFGLPLIRRYYNSNMPVNGCKKLVADVMRVLFYRDCRTINKITFAIVDQNGVTIEPPVALQTYWNLKEVNPITNNISFNVEKNEDDTKQTE